MYLQSAHRRPQKILRRWLPDREQTEVRTMNRNKAPRPFRLMAQFYDCELGRFVTQSRHANPAEAVVEGRKLRECRDWYVVDEHGDLVTDAHTDWMSRTRIRGAR